MLINKTFHDIPTKLHANGKPIRIFVISPVVPDYPDAKFPGLAASRYCLISHQLISWFHRGRVTGPVERFAGQIASQGFVVACPSVYHEFEGPEAIPYDTEGTDRGNKYKVDILTALILNSIEKELAGYDEVSSYTVSGIISISDATLTIDLLVSLKNCNGRIAATGMCLGGHLAAFDPRVLATVCFFATDIHSASLGKGKNDDTIIKVQKGDLKGKGELVVRPFEPKPLNDASNLGKDTHVTRQGRDLIRKTLEDANVPVSFLEVQAQHAFIRDEHSKGRWDAALTRSLFTFMMEVFERTVGRDLGRRVSQNTEPEHVC
ncbi:hypothetical protein CVT25_010236 [Psilocybe cyanescens]|uniref:Dienelactone hydrolase domain-containing protein n=1 Tax=Psilocybe cyanescens TaxID=93625 RepID=A0A409XD51_PSICY|nr:hypothetical protein CVT25_010236 [Psilocybe cyanescens]